MSEEIKKQETMDDFAQEIEASFSNFRDADMEIWDKLEQMKEDKEAFEVTIEGIVKGGAIAYVEGIRAFIPVSKLSLEYVKEPEEFLKKTLMVRVFEVDEAENRLVLSARELLKEQADAEKLAKTQQIAVGSVLEGTVESLQTYARDAAPFGPWQDGELLADPQEFFRGHSDKRENACCHLQLREMVCKPDQVPQGQWSSSGRGTSQAFLFRCGSS